MNRRAGDVGLITVFGVVLMAVASHASAQPDHRPTIAVAPQWSTVTIGTKSQPCLMVGADVKHWPADVIPPGYYGYLSRNGQPVDHKYTVACAEPIINDNDPTAPDAYVP